MVEDLKKKDLDSAVVDLQKEMVLLYHRAGGGSGAGHVRSGTIKGIELAIDKLNGSFGKSYESNVHTLQDYSRALFNEKKPVIKE